MHTHVGYTRETTRRHLGRLYEHGDYSGAVHALTGTANAYSGAAYKALCGEVVAAEHDGERFNVAPAGTDGWRVTCKRCLRLLGT